MINPIQSDTTHEWIELYNPTSEPVNLTSWTITDNTQTDVLEPNPIIPNQTMILQPNQYGIITDHGTEIFNHTQIPTNTLLLQVDDKSIGNGLGNENDEIILKNASDHIIDSLEWGDDDPDIPGEPIPTIIEGMSLIRTNPIDTNNTFHDFKQTQTPTPGEKNMYTPMGTISITTAPAYMAKAYRSESYSFPIAIQVHLENFTNSPYYDLKVAVHAKNTGPSIASQTWNGEKWQYSDRYLFNITTNDQGSYTQWAYLRFNPHYKSYQNHISHDSHAIIEIKIREPHHITTYEQEIDLLDMDDSSTNATPGGYYVNTFKSDQFRPLSQQTMVLTDKTGSICSIYPSEDNRIDEGFASINGFVKHPAPVGSDYILYQQPSDGPRIKIKDNITIKPGRYQVSIMTPDTDVEIKPKRSLTMPITLCNIGDFNDTYSIKIKDLSNGWSAKTSTRSISIEKHSNKNITLTIRPSKFIRNEEQHGQLILTVQSKKDLDSIDSKLLFFDLIGPDLTVPVIKTYDTNWKEIDTIQQGRNLKIKAYCKNMGNENASDVTIFFYLDQINQTSLIGSKHYDTISRYQKYPSVMLDTTMISPGNHMIYAIVDINDTIAEIDEYNNEHIIEFTITNTSPSPIEQQILIREFYYHTHPGIYNEYLCLYNPTNQSIDLSDFYLTTTPFKNYEKQTIISFPKHSLINAYSNIFITQTAHTFISEIRSQPDFEYKDDTVKQVPQMLGSTSFTLSNNGGDIALKNPFNHTIDFISYGNTTQKNHDQWTGAAIPKGSAGQIFKRISINHQFIDTNTKDDFAHDRLFFIGQTDLEIKKFQEMFSCDLFISPDSSYQSISQALDQAQHHIYLNMYEFTNMHLCDDLINCLNRNVTVTILMEGSPVGGISTEEWYLLHRLHSYGAKIYFISQDESNDIYARYPFNHAKYAIIDNESCIIESCNWAETGVPVHSSFGNREWGIIIHNDNITKYLSSVFLQDCNKNRRDIFSFEQMNMTIPNGYYHNTGTFYGSYSPQFDIHHVQENITIIPVFSPDISLSVIKSLIRQAKKDICIQQLYIYRNWTDQTNPFVDELINKAHDGVSVRVILNYNPFYEETVKRCNETKSYLETHGIQVRYIYTNQSPFTNIHNKGMIIDNHTILISSINWNENSVMRNRELGVIINSTEIAEFYAKVFYADWHLYDISDPLEENISEIQSILLPQNSIYIISVFTLTFVVIARDWRTRKWD